MRRSIIYRNLLKISVILIWILLWELVSRKVNQEILVVSPGTVLAALGGLMQTALFWQSVIQTILRISAGFILAIVAGVFLAVVSAFVPLGKFFLDPFIAAVKATPAVSFTVLALVWLKTGVVPVFISFFMTFPLIWSNTYAGIIQTDKQLLEMAQVFQIGWWKKIVKIYVPSVMPFFISALTTGVGIAWKSGISAEVIGIPKPSIGRQFYQSKIYLETDQLFAWTVVVILSSVIIEKLFVKLISTAVGNSSRQGGLS